MTLIVPTLEGEHAGSSAWGVTDNHDGTVTVSIRSIQDADGLERKLEEVGVPAAVHYLPQNKNCVPPGYEARMARRQQQGRARSRRGRDR